jgi:hypothetical protein
VPEVVDHQERRVASTRQRGERSFGMAGTPPRYARSPLRPGSPTEPCARTSTRMSLLIEIELQQTALRGTPA